MNSESQAADLHMHTTASDGTSTVEGRVEQARDRGLEAIAITDHDCIPEELDSRSKTTGGVELITGVEVKADIFDTKIEVLGYYVDPNSSELSKILSKVRGYREERNREMLDIFVEATDIQITYDEMFERVHGQLGRPHFARLLIEHGLVSSVSEAFDEYLGEDGDIYVATERVEYQSVIEAIHQSGGVASLAHPGRIDSERVPEMVAEMSDNGLDGIEVWYPYGELSSDRTSGLGVSGAKELSEEHGLLRTGGSDCHGEGSDKFRIGEVGVPMEELENLRSLQAS